MLSNNRSKMSAEDPAYTLSSVTNRSRLPTGAAGKIGVVGLYLFALSSLVTISFGNIGLGLMLVGFVLSIEAWRTMAKQPLFWVCLALIAYVLFRAFWAGQEFSTLNDLQLKQSKNWIQLFLFFVVSWWLVQDPRHLPTVLLLALTGFTVGILTSPDAALLFAKIPEGVRSGMHYGKPIIFGFHCAVMLLGLLLFAPRWLGHGRTAKINATLLILTMLLAFFFVQGLLVSQSRGVWLAVLITFPVTAFMFYRKTFLRNTHRKRAWVLWLAILAIPALIAASNWNLVSKRLSAEHETFAIIMQQGLDKAPARSSSFRFAMWRFGLEKWAERPLVGWGPGTTQFLVEQETERLLYNNKGEPWDHLHSFYIELLLQLGLIGTFLVAAIALLLLKGALQAYRVSQIPKDLFYFFIACMLLTAVYSLTDFRHLQWNWRYYWLLLAGIGFASQLRPALR